MEPRRPRRAAAGRWRGVNRTRYARSGALRIAYELRGTMRRRRPWLVLIQGMGLDRQGWGPVLRRLRRHFRLVLVDNRGLGQSDRPTGWLAVADMAGDVVAVLDAAGIRRAHVLGASLGGMAAQELAIRHPERVDASALPAPRPAGLLPTPCPPPPGGRLRPPPACRPRWRCAAKWRTPPASGHPGRLAPSSWPAPRRAGLSPTRCRRPRCG